jgi:tRNA A-37 threonylcarbamoyl transferase component Bud32
MAVELGALSSRETKSIWNTLAPVVAKSSVEALCAYGSRIAGYSEEESDYDIMLILRSFPQRIRYQYIKGEVYCSALVVESKSFEGDCKRSTLGEFVSGRLLNKYDPIFGAPFLWENEVAYKERVILDEILQAVFDNLHFSQEIEFDLEYFLFEKLRRRAAIYPPVVYSYAKTYGRPLRDSNLLASLQGFAEAARRLSSKQKVIFDEARRTVKLNPKSFKPTISSWLANHANNTARTIAQYAVHGYAGRVGIGVIGREVASKLSRSKRQSKLPDEILHPKRLYWHIPGVALYPETEDWVSDLSQLLGFERDSIVIDQEAMGEIYASTRILTFRGKGNTFSFAVKRFQDLKAMKWGLLSIWSLKNTDFTFVPLERMAREYRAFKEFPKFGIMTPRVVAVFLSERLLVSTFVKGKDLSIVESLFLEERTEDLSAVHKFGEVVAKIHNHDYCLGDSKPSSAIETVQGRQICLVDLEQAHPGGNKAWDIAEFVFYSVRFTAQEDRAMRLVKSFLNGYLSAGGDPDIVRKAASLRYRAPFQAFIVPSVLSSAIRALRNTAG